MKTGSVSESYLEQLRGNERITYSGLLEKRGTRNCHFF